MVAVQQLPLPEKIFGLRGQKFDFRAFYSPLFTPPYFFHIPCYFLTCVVPFLAPPWSSRSCLNVFQLHNLNGCEMFRSLRTWALWNDKIRRITTENIRRYTTVLSQYKSHCSVGDSWGFQQLLLLLLARHTGKHVAEVQIRPFSSILGPERTKSFFYFF